ncbi:uroporphyrinogen-III synthase [Longispora albida]|uniref:uroporphyrinogen-III synthase n=1 Tax=Longispora albida TaxID=203523 RepID=UPI00036BB803|nr:uroporphyrinogen-III synthase [Longispora albida]
MTGPLAGFTVAVTAERRRAELAAMFERRGARVVSAPALSIVPLADDAGLAAATGDCVTRPPDTVVATTGIGFRGWLEAAEGWGAGEELRAVLGRAELVARGPKSRGAIRAAGFAEAWHAESESCAEVLERLLAAGVTGRRIALQMHGEPQAEFVAALRAAGADVVEIPVYRWVPPPDPAPLRRLAAQITAGQVDAVTFTSAAAVTALLDLAGPEAPAILCSFRAGVLAACVGPVTAARLAAEGVPVAIPGRSRLGALVKTVEDELPARAVRVGTLDIRGHAVLVDGEPRQLPPAPMAVLRALAAEPGRVHSRAELLAALPRGADEHAVEMAVTRLRAALAPARYVQTIVKRGYRLRDG